MLEYADEGSEETLERDAEILLDCYRMSTEGQRRKLLTVARRCAGLDEQRDDTHDSARRGPQVRSWHW